MGTYQHGIRVIEESTKVIEPVTSTAALQVVVGTAPINLMENPAEAVNRPVLVTNLKECQERLGYSGDFEKYTLCQSMYASFGVFNVAPIVFINVLDPARHVTENPEKELPVSKGQATATEEGILKESVTVKGGEETLVKGTDYILSFDAAGKLVITMVSDKAQALGTVTVKSTSINPAAVTKEDIIGGYDVGTGKESGLEVVRQVYPITGMVPGQLLAPGWSHIQEVGAALMLKAENINGVYKCTCLMDLDTEKARIYTDCKRVKDECGYNSTESIVLYPMAEVNGKKLYYSAVYAAMTAAADAENDDVPNISPSNKLLKITKMVLRDGTEITLDRNQANVLNGQGIVTAINEGGFRSWGNNTAAYPENTDPKDRWICCRRMFNWRSNSLIQTYREKVDNPGNFRMIESICDSENILLSSLVAAGKMAGARVEYREEDNTVQDILNGEMCFRIYLAVYTPAEDILFILQFDPDMLYESMGGVVGGEA